MIDPKRKTLIFDFGNVLINLDFPRCFEAFKKTLGQDFSKGLPENTKAFMFRYEKGEVNTESFLWHLQQYAPQAEIRDIIDAWNAILSELPMSRLHMLTDLKEEYNVAMLSNINDMHEKKIHHRLESDMGIHNFHEEFFHQVFYSHKIGYRKPDPECYAFVQKSLGIEKGGDILFIDDMQDNITAAINYGWQAILHNPQGDILLTIEDYLHQAGF